MKNNAHTATENGWHWKVWRWNWPAEKLRRWKVADAFHLVKTWPMRRFITTVIT